MVPERYNLRNLRAAVQNPRKFTRELFRISTPILKRKLERAHGQETDVMTEDWDNLVIIDACRYDHFTKHPPEFGDRLRKIVSRESTSQEFMTTRSAEKHCTIRCTCPAIRSASGLGRTYYFF